MPAYSVFVGDGTFPEVTSPKSTGSSCCGARHLRRRKAPSSSADRCHALSSLHPPPAALASLPNSTMPAYFVHFSMVKTACQSGSREVV